MAKDNRVNEPKDEREEDAADQLMSDLFNAQEEEAGAQTAEDTKKTEDDAPGMEEKTSGAEPFSEEDSAARESELIKSQIASDDVPEPSPAYPAEQEETPEIGVEAFVPTEFYQREAKPRRKKRRRRKGMRPIWITLIVLAAALLALGGAYAYRVLYNPSAFFGSQALSEPIAATPTTQIQQVETVDATATPEPAATPTPDPYSQLVAQADTSIMQNIINVLVIGVDYAEERDTWNGKHDYHSDVMMLLAINFDENRVDLISLPRDTYAQIPGVNGIYKLNASLNCGGGMDAPGGSGFLKTCEAASWMVGGVPVDYYYAVTMPAVKGLVDAVGGVDYDLEMSYTMMGRKYKAGQQHMDGQGVLDYLRVRKNIASSGDWNRVNRQKKMMVALFQSMQEQNLITKIPDIINSFTGQLYTNCSLSQTAALAAFAYKLNSENIGMYSMSGTMKNIFNWNFCITDQENRVKIIKSVYGIDVPQEKEYNMTYAVYRWADMRAEAYLKRCESLTEYAKNAISRGESLPSGDATTTPGGEILLTPDAPTPGDGVIEGGNLPAGEGTIWQSAPAGGRSTTGYMSATYSLPQLTLNELTYSGDLYSTYVNLINEVEDGLTYARKEAAKYVDGKKNSLSSAGNSLSSSLTSLTEAADALIAATGQSSISWTVRYENDSSFNEVKVDFN